MEAKDTGKYSISTVVDVGNDAFKDGRKAGYKEGINAGDYYEGLVEGEHIGTKKVVDWIVNNSYDTTIHFGDDWKAKLKEWEHKAI